MKKKPFFDEEIIIQRVPKTTEKEAVFSLLGGRNSTDMAAATAYTASKESRDGVTITAYERMKRIGDSVRVNADDEVYNTLTDQLLDALFNARGNADLSTAGTRFIGERVLDGEMAMINQSGGAIYCPPCFDVNKLGFAPGSGPEMTNETKQKLDENKKSGKLVGYCLSNTNNNHWHVLIENNKSEPRKKDAASEVGASSSAIEQVDVEFYSYNPRKPRDASFAISSNHSDRDILYNTVINRLIMLNPSLATKSIEEQEKVVEKCTTELSMPKDFNNENACALLSLDVLWMFSQKPQLAGKDITEKDLLDKRMTRSHLQRHNEPELRHQAHLKKLRKSFYNENLTKREKYGKLRDLAITKILLPEDTVRMKQIYWDVAKQNARAKTGNKKPIER